MQFSLTVATNCCCVSYGITATVWQPSKMMNYQDRSLHQVSKKARSSHNSRIFNRLLKSPRNNCWVAIVRSRLFSLLFRRYASLRFWEGFPRLSFETCPPNPPFVHRDDVFVFENQFLNSHQHHNLVSRRRQLPISLAPKPYGIVRLSTRSRFAQSICQSYSLAKGGWLSPRATTV